MAEAAHSPLEQFKIDRLFEIHVGGVDVSFTNSALFMVIAIIVASAIVVLGSRGRSLVPSRWQSMAEISGKMILSEH